MMCIRIYLSLSLCLLAFILSASLNELKAQDTDIGFRADIGAEKQLSKRWGLALKEEFRFDKHISHLDKYFTALAVTFMPLPFMELTGDYRFIRKANESGSREEQHRFDADLTLKHDIQKFALDYRLRFVSYPRRWNIRMPEPNYVRLRARLKRDIEHLHLAPYFSAELFHEIPEKEKSKFSRLRYFLGTVYTTPYQDEIDFFLGMENKFNIENPTTEYFLGISYTFVLNSAEKNADK